MFILIMMFTIILIICAALATIATTVSEKTIKDREKNTPFECGFSPIKKARSVFSLRFFTTTLIFLIFDIELALLLPLGFLTSMTNNSHMIMTGLIITLILLLGLLHEWNLGALEWVN